MNLPRLPELVPDQRVFEVQFLFRKILSFDPQEVQPSAEARRALSQLPGIQLIK